MVSSSFCCLESDLSDRGHFASELADGADDLLRSLFGRLFNPVDIPREKTLVNAKCPRNFGNVQERESLEDIRNRVVRVRLSRQVEAADVDVFIDVVPVNIIPGKATPGASG